jgi:hypothetical protein
MEKFGSEPWSEPEPVRTEHPRMPIFGLGLGADPNRTIGLGFQNAFEPKLLK